MFFSSKLADFFARLASGLLLGLLLGFLISEAAYFFMPNRQASREPRRVDLVIPEGTAAQIQAGTLQSMIPSSLQFVQGDVLVVKNEDVVAHQLGPLFIPPKSSSRLALDSASTYNYSCSYQPDAYQGLQVLPGLSLKTRVEGLLAIGMPTGMMLVVYSYLIPNSAVPWKKKSMPHPG